MSPADLAAWTRAAEACERESPGTGQFWRAVRECLAETQRSVASGEEEPETETTTSETGDSRHLRALEASWELLFVAARVWRSVELDGGGRVAETDPSAGRVSRGSPAKGGGNPPPPATARAEPAWHAVSEQYHIHI